MIFRLDTQKAIEAVATLLRLAPRRIMGTKRLLALLYLADRKSLEKTGRPIIGGKLAALPYGPIHSEVYDLIKGGHKDQPKWSGHFERDGYCVVLAHDPGVSALSRYEITVLNDVSAGFMGFDDWDVANETHKFEEYKRTYREGTSTPIPLERLIEAVGRAEQKDAILQTAEEKAYFDQLFASNP